MSVYHIWLVCVMLLWANAVNSDRNALRIVLVASLLSTLVINPLTVNIVAAEKLAIPGAVETLTIFALVTLGRSRSAYIQAILLLVAWWAHLQCYADLIWHTNVIYDQYEKVIAGVAVCQLLAFHDSAFSIGRAIQKWANHLAVSSDFLSASGSSTCLVRDADNQTEQNPSK